MSRKEEYKEKNLLYLDEIASEEGIRTLPCGILYKVIQAGTGKVSPNRESVVSVHYKGTLINGREFDNSWKRGCPEAFRLNQVRATGIPKYLRNAPSIMESGGISPNRMMIKVQSHSLVITLYWQIV